MSHEELMRELRRIMDLIFADPEKDGEKQEAKT